MADPADIELQREPQTLLPPPRQPPPLTPLILGAVVLAAVVAAFVYLRQDAAAPASPAGAASTEAQVSPPAPLGVDVEPIELPPLDASDELVRQLVGALSSHPTIAAWLTTNGLIRNFTVVVENIAAGRTPAGHLRVLRPAQPFAIVEARGREVVIDPRSYRRYDNIAAAVASVDADGAAKLYSVLKPRIEDAHRELGLGGSFDALLETAIVRLLEAPAVDGELALLPRGALWEFNDPRLARLTQAQKQLVRMGGRNVRVIQRTLRDVALALGVPPERLPTR
jgi:hypothetical protein